MTDVNKSSGYAFPKAGLDPWHVAQQVNNGTTLRDYFAAKSLQGLLSNDEGPIQKSHQRGWDFCNCKPEDVANLSYAIADAMMKARSK